MLLPLLMNLGMLGQQTGIVGGGSSRDRLRLPQYRRPPTDDEKRRQREELGILPRRIINEVAARQADSLGLDEQQRLEELARELEAAGVQWESRYLAALNARRQTLIDQEIGRLLQERQRQEDEALVLILAASL